jgi:2,5-diketo-D-gluconate reductase A
VDLMLVHNPCTELDDYIASSYPHLFELGNSRLTEGERELVLAHRFKGVKLDPAAAEASRAASWKALEAAQAAGKARYIGVSNYPSALVQAMAPYAKLMPAVNQLELHPRFASPALRAYAAGCGMALTAYGSGNSARIMKSEVIQRIAAARGTSPVEVVLRWTLQKGVAVIPRTATPTHMAENLAVASAPPLSDADVAAVDALNRAWPYYWHPAPLFPEGTYVPDC